MPAMTARGRLMCVEEEQEGRLMVVQYNEH